MKKTRSLDNAIQESSKQEDKFNKTIFPLTLVEYEMVIWKNISNVDMEFVEVVVVSTDEQALFIR